MPSRDAVKVVSAAKPHVSRSLGRIANHIDNGSPRSLRILERERRFLNALGLSVNSKIRSAVTGEIIQRLDQQEELERLDALAEEAAGRLTLSDIDEIKSRLDKVRSVRRLRQEKLGDKAVRRISREGVSAKAPTMAEFADEAMEVPRNAQPRIWVWTANASACAVCLSLHGSRREGAFNPPHPNCLCIPEAPGGPSRRLTDQEIGDQMIRRGGRDAELGRALKDGAISRDRLRLRRGGIIKQRNVGIPKVSGPTARYRNTDFLDRVASSDPTDFYSGFAEARRGKYGAFLSDFDADHFAAENVRTYTAYDGKVGAALTDHGDGRIEVGSLFATGDAPEGAGRDLLRYLVRERDANWLNNFDGPLTEFYIDEGFQVVSRSPWNPEFAPEGWDEALFGTPDYVEMAKT